jgi:hypothetical protein
MGQRSLLRWAAGQLAVADREMLAGEELAGRVPAGEGADSWLARMLYITVRGFSWSTGRSVRTYGEQNWARRPVSAWKPQVRWRIATSGQAGCKPSAQPAIGSADVPQDVYMARGADLVGEPEIDKAEAVRWVLVAEAQDMIRRGESLGAATISACWTLPQRWQRRFGIRPDC